MQVEKLCVVFTSGNVPCRDRTVSELFPTPPLPTMHIVSRLFESGLSDLSDISSAEQPCFKKKLAESHQTGLDC